MKKQSKQTRLPGSFRTDAKQPAGMTRTTLALGISTAMLLPTAAFAQAAGDGKNSQQLQAVKVESTAIDPNPNAQPGVPYKAQLSGDRRRTKPLAETPTTIQVLTAEAIKDSGATDLREILNAQPGITLGTGENGNAFGDRYIIRGQEARSDVFVDGLRDPGMSIRESFAVDQIEISKGPSSSFAGRGTAGGAVNAITKQATTDLTFTKLSAGLGSDNYQRYTLDANLPVGEQFAARANVLWAKSEVPDRDPAERDRKGIALSGLWRASDALDVTLDYYGFRGHDNPDIGTYIIRATNKVMKPSRVPAYAQDSDFLQSDVDTFTSRINYRFNDAVTLNNLTRYGSTDNGYITTGAGPATTGANNPGGVYNTSTLDGGHTGWQEVEYFANQTNLFINTELAGMKHEFIVGLEYTNHHATRGNFSTGIPAGEAGGRNCITGTGTALNAFCITDASGNRVDNLYTLQNRNVTKNRWSNDWNVKTVSAYIMDTVDLTDDWTVFGGLRLDRYDHSVTSVNASTRVVAYDIDADDNLVNGHVGVTYQITPAGMVYLSAATATDINGGESDANGAGYGGLIVLDGEMQGDPEKSESIELGTKWNLFDERLLLTGAVFQTTKSDVMESLSGADYGEAGTYNTGKNRVRGFEIGAVGEIVDGLTVQAGYTVMESEVLKSFNPVYVGAPLANFAQNSSFVQLKYQATDAFSFGAGSRYESQRRVGQPDTAAVNADGSLTRPLPSYTVFNAFANYRVNKALDFQLNVKNLTDKAYYLAGYRSGNFVYIGDARSYVLTANYQF